MPLDCFAGVTIYITRSTFTHNSNIRLWQASYGILKQHPGLPSYEKFICDVFLLVGVLARHVDGSDIYFVGHRRRR